MSERAYHHGDLPAAALDEVAAILRERGLGGVSLREVARRAGVSHSAPTHHFGSKAGLLTAFATQGYERLAAEVLGEVGNARPADGAEMLAAIGRGYVRFAMRHPEQFGVMFRPELLDPQDAALVAASDAAYALLRATVDRCRLEGLLDGADPETVAVAAWSLVHGLASLWLSGRMEGRIAETDPDHLAAAVCALFVSRVLPRPRPVPSST